MTTLPWVTRLNITRTITVVPTITANSAYASGNQIGGIMTLADVLRQDSQVGYGNCELHSVTIIDGNKQDAAIDIWFFNVSPTLTNAGDKSAFSITAANLKAAGAFAISVGSTYSDSSVASMSTDGGNIGKNIQVSGSSATPTSIFAVAVVRGTPTYTVASNLQFEFTFYVD